MSPVSTNPSSSATRAASVAQIARARCRRADAQRAVFDLASPRRCAASVEELAGKPSRLIVDLEADAGLGRGIGVADAGLADRWRAGCRGSLDRRSRPTSAHSVARIDRPRRAPQHAPPMRGRAGDMRHAACARSALEESCERFAGLSESTSDAPPIIARRKICSPP